MVKGTVGAGGVFLGALWSGVLVLIVVGALGVAVSLRRFLDLEVLGGEADGWKADENVVVDNTDNH